MTEPAGSPRDGAGRSAEWHERLHADSGVRVDRIVSTGYSSPEGEWYDQSFHEWVMVLVVEGTLEFEDHSTVTLRVGQHITLPAHRRHRIARTSSDPPCVWLAVYYGRESS